MLGEYGRYLVAEVRSIVEIFEFAPRHRICASRPMDER